MGGANGARLEQSERRCHVTSQAIQSADLNQISRNLEEKRG